MPIWKQTNKKSLNPIQSCIPISTTRHRTLDAPRQNMGLLHAILWWKPKGQNLTGETLLSINTEWRQILLLLTGMGASHLQWDDRWNPTNRWREPGHRYITIVSLFQGGQMKILLTCLPRVLMLHCLWHWLGKKKWAYSPLILSDLFPCKMRGECHPFPSK